MWNLINCYLAGRHEYGVWCEPGTVFLRCAHCGRRSSGWSLGASEHTHAAAKPAPKAPVTVAAVLPFKRAAAN
jgi:hypothetical protein